MNKNHFIIITILEVIIGAFLALSMIYANIHFLFIGNFSAFIGAMVLLCMYHRKLLPDKCKYWIYIDYVLAVFPIWVLFFVMCATVL